MILFALPFLAGGFFFAIVSFRSFDDPNFKNPEIGIVVGCGIALLGAPAMLAGFRVRKSAQELAATQAAYPMQITDAAGREKSIGNALSDHNEAEWVCAQIRQLANVKAKTVSA